MVGGGSGTLLMAGVTGLLQLLVLHELAIDGRGHARSAEAALGAMKRRETLVDGMVAVSLIAQPFRGGDDTPTHRTHHHQKLALLHLPRLRVVSRQHHRARSIAA